jgi:predicted nucleic acid-binding protein
VTTNLVIAESYIILRLELGHGPALAFLDHIKASPRIVRVYSTPELEAEAEETLRRYEDQDFSFTDAVSFAVMRARDITTAFAFDAHFATAGFANVPAAS